VAGIRASAKPRHPAGWQPADEPAHRRAATGRRHRRITTAAREQFARGRERGSGTAATVVVMGLLGLIVLGMVQYAADIHGQQAAQAAASIALATAREQNGSAAAGQAAATAELAQLTTAIHDPAVDVQRSATEVTVTITGSVTGLLGITQQISVTSAGPVDHFTTNVAASGS
jgi:Flp pilus assembly protein TadG